MKTPIPCPKCGNDDKTMRMGTDSNGKQRVKCSRCDNYTFTLESERLPMSVNVIYTAHATSAGGRNGHTQSDDGFVSVDLSIPKEMGGPGKPGTSTPEHLFAAGYAACFGSACEYVARQQHLRPTSIEVHAAVGIGQTAEGGFGLTVQLEAQIGGLSQVEAEKLVAAGHEICPYSRAIHGNVKVQIKAIAV